MFWFLFCIVGELKVTNLRVPDDTTTETSFIVKWEIPDNHDLIDKYLLVIGSETPLDIADTSTTLYSITSRVPGRKYNITLKSIETASRPTSQETSVSVTDGCSKLCQMNHSNH